MPKIDTHEAYPVEPDTPASAPATKVVGALSAWRFKLAVLKYRRLVYGVAYSLLRDRHEAEDASQEAYLRYWQQGAGVEHPRQWLVTVVRRLCLDRLRQRGRFVDGEPAEEEGPVEERDPAWHCQQRELGARLRHLIETLPEPQRSLVVLFDVHGVDGATCAQMLDLNRNQVKVYLHRARRKLRAALEGSS